MRKDATPLLKVTVLLESRDGDHVCLNCKRLFAVIQAESIFPGADTNFCPHCGAKVLGTADVGDFSDVKAVDE